MILKCKIGEKTLSSIGRYSFTNSLKKPVKVSFNSAEIMFLRAENRALKEKCGKINRLDEVAKRAKSNLPMTIKDCSLFFDVGETTIRKCYKEYLKAAGKPATRSRTIRANGHFLKFFKENCIK